MTTVTPEQQYVLEAIYGHVRSTGRWPGAKALRRQLYRAKKLRLEEVMEELGHEIAVCNDVTSDGSLCMVHLPALQHIPDAEGDRVLIGKLVPWLLESFLAEKQDGVLAETVAGELGADIGSVRRVIGFTYSINGLIRVGRPLGNDVLGCVDFNIDDNVLKFDGVASYDNLLERLAEMRANYRAKTAQTGLTLRAAGADLTRDADVLSSSAIRRQWGKWVASDAGAFGRSNLSFVWRVRDRSDPKSPLVALKEMRYDKRRASTAYRRFVREIDTLAELLRGRHVGIVEVIDFAIPGDGEESDPYYVMPLAETTLQRASKALAGRLENVLDVAVVIAEALDAAHTAGVIHRDVKPANVLLFGDEQRPVVCDFGICYLNEEHRLTALEGQTVGTDEFVAPELRGGGPSDKITPAADVYSLGKTIFAAASGGDVFPREYFRDPRFNLVRRFNDERFGHLVGLMERMVTEDPAARVQSMPEVRDLLLRALNNIRSGVRYSDGMYASGRTPLERHGRLRRLLSEPVSIARSDAIRAETESSLELAREIARSSRDGQLSPASYGDRISEPAARVAGQVCEIMLAAGLPLIQADLRDDFEEWLGGVMAGLEVSGRDNRANGELVLEAAAIAATLVAGAIAWRRRRLHLLRLVLDRLSARGSSWMHQEILQSGQASALNPWVNGLAAESDLVCADCPDFTIHRDADLGFVGGLIVLKHLRLVPSQEVDEFLVDPRNVLFGFPLFPGLFNVTWAAQLLELARTRPPLERSMAMIVFDLETAAFREFLGEQTPRIVALHAWSSSVFKLRPLQSLGVNPERWSEYAAARPDATR